MAKYEIAIDEEIIEKARKIYSDLGIELSTAIRMFLIKTIKEQGIPFDLTLRTEYKAYEAARAAIKISEHAERIGIADMSLEEINWIIAETRKAVKERRARTEP